MDYILSRFGPFLLICSFFIGYRIKAKHGKLQKQINGGFEARTVIIHLERACMTSGTKVLFTELQKREKAVSLCFMPQMSI